jgi:hypothetical protein
MAGEGVSFKLAFIGCTMHGWLNGLCAQVRQDSQLRALGRESACSDLTEANSLKRS